MEDTSSQFWELVDAATRADEELLDTRLIEPYLLRVLEFVQSRPSKRDLFAQHFVALATAQRTATHYLVPFCMRTLRFPEVLAAVEQAISDGREAFGPLRQWPLLFDVRDAYRDPWPDAVLFPHYAGEASIA